MKAKRSAEPGRALNQVLSVENLDRAGVTSMAVTGGTHEPLDVVLRQVAIGELGTDEQAQGFIVHAVFPGGERSPSQIHPDLDASRRQREKLKVQAPASIRASRLARRRRKT